jgi:hypothetical protein
MHYSNPVPTMRMLEVIYTEETTQEAIDICCMVGEAQDKAISLVRDKPGTYGFILNRVFAAAFREGLKIVEDGIATRCESRGERTASDSDLDVLLWMMKLADPCLNVDMRFLPRQAEDKQT